MTKWNKRKVSKHKKRIHDIDLDDFEEHKYENKKIKNNKIINFDYLGYNMDYVDVDNFEIKCNCQIEYEKYSKEDLIDLNKLLISLLFPKYKYSLCLSKLYKIRKIYENIKDVCLNCYVCNM